MMKTLPRRIIALVLLAGGACAVTGCSTYRHEYPGHGPEQVWAAAMSVAQSPDYEGDWHVTRNHVWIDDDWARMEIEREIRRLTHEPFTESSPEKRNWQFRVTMEGGEPVVLTFGNRNPTIPGWTLSEAQRFFNEVDDLLLAVPAAGVGESAAMDEPITQPEVKFEEPATQAEIAE